VSFAREVAKLGNWYGTSAAITKNQYEVEAEEPESGMDTAIRRVPD
jgi:hypothetical protein